MNQEPTVPVWDLFVRVFHWLLVVAFCISYITEGDPKWLHLASGYSILALVLARILWGFFGSPHARFSDFVPTWRSLIAYLRALRRGEAELYVGHNPAGGAMVVALLLSLLVTTGAGLVLLAAEEGEGPLSGWLIAAPSTGALEELEYDSYDEESEPEHHESALAEAAEEVHELFANLTLMLVAVHILGVVFESWRERQNLARAMVTGRKRIPPKAPLR
ncbi:MAG: cytochrome b/b6 domain-containing protein [Pseudomonadota bacterium]|nr:cytochrome b/b6 domain-containing protein [Pseudomonadota bacterium]